MPEITSLNEGSAQQILSDHYGLQDLQALEPLSGGMANSSYFCHFAKHPRVILTVMDYFVRRNDFDRAINVGELMAALREESVRAPAPLLTLTKAPVALVSHEGDTLPVIVKEFIEGECFDYLPDQYVKEAGRALARVHRIDTEKKPFCKSKSQAGRLPKNYRETAHSFEDRDFADWVVTNHLQLECVFERSESPRTFIHGDLFADNVVVADGGQIAILDWELASIDCRLFDVAMAIVGLCRETDRVSYSAARHKSLLEGYSDELGENGLSARELDSLADAIAYCAVKVGFWRYVLNNLGGRNRQDERYKEMVEFVRSLRQTL